MRGRGRGGALAGRSTPGSPADQYAGLGREVDSHARHTLRYIDRSASCIARQASWHGRRSLAELLQLLGWSPPSATRPQQTPSRTVNELARTYTRKHIATALAAGTAYVYTLSVRLQ